MKIYPLIVSIGTKPTHSVSGMEASYQAKRNGSMPQPRATSSDNIRGVRSIPGRKMNTRSSATAPGAVTTQLVLRQHALVL